MTDMANNSAEATYQYEVDNTPINIILNDLLNNSVITSKTRPNMTFSEEPLIQYYYIEGHSTENQTLIPRPPYINGSILFHVYVSDGLNWNHKIFLFTVEHYLAKVKIFYPFNGTTVNKDTIFNITYTGERIKCYFQWNNQDNLTILTVPPVSGNYILTIRIQDVSLVWLVFRYYYVVDNDAPEVLSTHPEIKVIVGRNITFSCSEELSKVIYKWDLEENFTTLLITGVRNFTLKVPNKSGNHSVTILLTDIVGNEGEFKEYFIIEKTEAQKFFETLIVILPIVGILGLAIGTGAVIGIRKSKLG
jgi:hypothetical protein